MADLRPYWNETDRLAHRSIAMSRLSKLPPFRPTAMQLLMVSTESDSAVKDFERAFQGDPALASHLLMVANSPLYGFSSRVDSVKRAIMLLGLEGVRSLSFTIGLGTYVKGAAASAVVRSVWNHSLATAVIAEAIGKASGHDVPFLYTAGLVHDVGRLGLLSIEGARYAEVLSRSYLDLEESLLLEEMTCGCSHDEAGGFLAPAWGFPQTLCDCIRHHHRPNAADGSQMLLQMAQLACHKADELGYGEIVCDRQEPVAMEESLVARIGRAPGMKAELLRDRIGRMIEALVGEDRR